MSGFIAADIALSSATSYPWSAPAGFSRGVLTGITDIAINPTQKHRDLLYKININPVAYFPGDGYVIFGQKTLFNKPSAFDRINVRRLFLTLEKVVQRLLKYYVFEGNTYTTRIRLVNSLLPLFNQAKNSDGLYDFRIICDERNNTPDVIDDNAMKIAIYIQPVRTAEFILADFVATRSGSDFTEITS
jgi:phage tail sheath protein FI